MRAIYPSNGGDCREKLAATELVERECSSVSERRSSHSCLTPVFGRGLIRRCGSSLQLGKSSRHARFVHSCSSFADNRHRVRVACFHCGSGVGVKYANPIPYMMDAIRLPTID